MHVAWPQERPYFHLTLKREIKTENNKRSISGVGRACYLKDLK
jgi:hypothetical protein